MEISRIPVTSVQTGFIQEERSFDWKIINFPMIRKNRSMVDSQKFDFYAGESIGMASKWRAYLSAEEKEGVTWAGIFVRLLEKPRSTSTREHLYAQLIFTFKGKDGAIKKKKFVTKVVDWYDPTVIKNIKTGYGISKVFDMNEELPSFMELVNGCLVVHVTFNLFAPAQATQPLKVKLEEFEVKSVAKARADLATMLTENRVPTKDIKIIANDQKEFKMQKDILSARSPVFRAMLEADMTEGNAGVVEIQDMGSESLKVLLHFMSRGELLPEWMSTDVLVELTNAAAKYEITDLLNFLDGVLGDVCNLRNVGMLLSLAKQLSLTTAESDLMCYLRRKGTSSSDNFLQVSSGILASDSGTFTGESGGQIEGRPGSSSCACCRRRRQGKRTADEMDEDNAVEKPKRNASK